MVVYTLPTRVRSIVSGGSKALGAQIRFEEIPTLLRTRGGDDGIAPGGEQAPAAALGDCGKQQAAAGGGGVGGGGGVTVQLVLRGAAAGKGACEDAADAAACEAAAAWLSTVFDSI